MFAVVTAITLAVIGGGAIGSAAVPSTARQIEPGGDSTGPVDPSPCRPPWIRPVEAPVVDPFRPPAHRFGPGNRGIEYGTDAGDPVVAVDGGIVAFAGPVAGSPVVVIEHGDGLRSTYTNLAAALVDRREIVTAGRSIARADTGFHLGARRGDDYVDPELLLAGWCEVIRLVAI